MIFYGEVRILFSIKYNLINMNYTGFLNEISSFIPRERIYTDELRRLAWGTDAGFYRLIPQIVIRSANEQEISRLLAVADRFSVPLTFRAAGTSLSGQAVSDSVLIVAGKHWKNYSISEDKKTISLQPGIIGERVNEILKPYGRKFSPDPASVKSAMVGGIIMNNASGMNCGTHANSDRVLISARIIFADGILLDTGDSGKGILNPGVIFNDDPNCHIKNFKPLPLISKEVDKCIECGFCEVNCLTCGFTLSSRQRIVLQREITRLKATGEDSRLLRNCLNFIF